MTIDSSLKPCPFCGAPAQFARDPLPVDHGVGDRLAISCSKSPHARVGGMLTHEWVQGKGYVRIQGVEEALANEWNRRFA